MYIYICINIYICILIIIIHYFWRIQCCSPAPWPQAYRERYLAWRTGAAEGAKSDLNAVAPWLGTTDILKYGNVLNLYYIYIYLYIDR